MESSVVCQLRRNALERFAGLNAPITERLAELSMTHCNVIHEAASAQFDIGLISRPLELTDLETASCSLASGSRAFRAEMQTKTMVPEISTPPAPRGFSIASNNRHAPSRCCHRFGKNPPAGPPHKTNARQILASLLLRVHCVAAVTNTSQYDARFKPGSLPAILKRLGICRIRSCRNGPTVAGRPRTWSMETAKHCLSK